MNARIFDYLYIAATIGLTVYGQIILKWRMRGVGPLPEDSYEKLKFLVCLIFDPAIFSCFAAAFLASLTWMAAMTKFELSHAYPMTSLNFVFVLLLSGWLLSEPLTTQRVAGVGLIVLGTLVASRG